MINDDMSVNIIKRERLRSYTDSIVYMKKHPTFPDATIVARKTKIIL